MAPNGEVHIGDTAYDGRVVLYILKGSLDIALLWFNLTRTSRSNKLHQLHQALDSG
jgi:hypothetical protein